MADFEIHQLALISVALDKYLVYLEEKVKSCYSDSLKTRIQSTILKTNILLKEHSDNYNKLMQDKENSDE